MHLMNSIKRILQRVCFFYLTLYNFLKYEPLTKTVNSPAFRAIHKIPHTSLILPLPKESHKKNSFFCRNSLDKSKQGGGILKGVIFVFFISEWKVPLKKNCKLVDHQVSVFNWHCPSGTDFFYCNVHRGFYAN